LWRPSGWVEIWRPAFEDDLFAEPMGHERPDTAHDWGNPDDASRVKFRF
jgi:hypothetical protein